MTQPTLQTILDNLYLTAEQRGEFSDRGIEEQDKYVDQATTQIAEALRNIIDCDHPKGTQGNISTWRTEESWKIREELKSEQRTALAKFLGSDPKEG